MEINPVDENQFKKIKLLDSMTDQLIGYGVRCGYENLPDYVDLNCGAIPNGDFEQVIDVGAPKQFLSMYVQIAESRFAFAVTELLKIKATLLKQIYDFCFSVGEGLEIDSIENLEDALFCIDSIVLDGMPDSSSKKIIEQSADKIVLEKTLDNHEFAWKKYGGNLEVYYHLQEGFANGILNKSGFEYKIENCKNFILSKKK